MNLAERPIPELLGRDTCRTGEGGKGEIPAPAPTMMDPSAMVLCRRERTSCRVVGRGIVSFVCLSGCLGVCLGVGVCILRLGGG